MQEYCSFIAHTHTHTHTSSQRYTDWVVKFGHQLGKRVVMLTGETSVDLRLLRDVSTLLSHVTCMQIP